jgi:hypothetical protein
MLAEMIIFIHSIKYTEENPVGCIFSGMKKAAPYASGAAVNHRDKAPLHTGMTQ